jgi:hypothetical protein
MVKKPPTIDISDTSIERHRKFSQRIRVECEIESVSVSVSVSVLSVELKM